MPKDGELNGFGAPQRPFDLIVIGGGINGAGIARDAALRGMSVALFEMRDFSTGATWASSGMIHGGLRYLSRNPEVTRLACLDSGYIQQIAPHLIFRIPFLLPWREGGLSARVVFELAEVYFSVYDRYQPLKKGKRHTRMTVEETLAIEPGIRPDILGSITMDEWGIDAQRLTIINALQAQEIGARVETYHRVEDVLRSEDGRAIGVRVRDRVGGGHEEVFGRVVFNATGPWAMQTGQAAGVRSVKVRPGKGVHLVYPGRLTNFAVLAEAIDGRQIFICPHQNSTLVGTTDDDYYGDLEEIPVTEDEVEYLTEGIESIFPSIRRYRPIGTTAGCRPTLYGYGQYEDDLSRAHQIFDHGSEGLDGFYSMAGGKLASYRVMAEEAVDIVAERLGVRTPCSTHERRLPGGDEPSVDVEEFGKLGVDAVTARRILYRHGANAEQIFDMMADDLRLRALVDPFEPVTEAEMRYVLRNEHVRMLDDLKRRCRLGVAVDGGARSAVRAAQIFCEELDLERDLVSEVARDFLQTRWDDRRSITFGPQRASEELAEMTLFLAARAERAPHDEARRRSRSLPAVPDDGSKRRSTDDATAAEGQP